MPARRDYTPEELMARLLKEREQARLRMARWRLRQQVTHTQDAVTVTPIRGEAARHATPPPSDSPLPSSSTKTTPDAAERLAARVAHYAKRDPKGRVAKAEDFRRLAKAFPALDLEVEVPAAEDWLESVKGQKRLCTYAFLKNWMEGQTEKRKAREALPPPLPPVNGHTWNGVYVQPNSLRHNRQPPSDDDRLPLGELLPIPKAEFQRTVEANRGLTLEQKRARLTARLNGTSPGGRPA